MKQKVNLRDEAVKSLRNRCEIYLRLCPMKDSEPLLRTQLEDICYYAQATLEKYCLEGK